MKHGMHPDLLALRLLSAAARPLWHHRVEGCENIDPSTFPAVFVCNHDGPFGPMAAVLFLPVPCRPWIYAPNLDRNQTGAELYKRTFAPNRWLPPKAGRMLSAVCAPPLHRILHAYDPIPVHRGTGKGILHTLTETTAAMARGQNILLFPENRRLTPDNRFPANGVGPFYSGFTAIAQGYTGATGRPCVFYPCFEGRSQQVFRIGKPVAFYADGGGHHLAQRREMAAALHEAVYRLSLK